MVHARDQAVGQVVLEAQAQHGLVEAEELVGLRVERAEAVLDEEGQCALAQVFHRLCVDDMRALEGGRYHLALGRIGGFFELAEQVVLGAGRRGPRQAHQTS